MGHILSSEDVSTNIDKNDIRELQKLFDSDTEDCHEVFEMDFVDMLYSTTGELKFHILSMCDKVNLKFENETTHYKNETDDDDDDSRPTCVLKWGYIDNIKKPIIDDSRPIILKEIKPSENIFKFTESHHDMVLVHTLNIDAACRERMDSSKIYMYSIKLPVHLLTSKNLRIIVEYNNIKTEISHLMGEFEDCDVHLWGSFVKSLKTENVVHFSPDIYPKKHSRHENHHDDQNLIAKGKKKYYCCCCISPQSVYGKIETVENYEVREFFEKYKKKSLPERQNFTIIPFTETAHRHLDDLLRHCRDAKYDINDEIFFMFNNEDSSSPKATNDNGSDYNNDVMMIKHFKSLDDFEKAIKDFSFISKCKEKKNWFPDIFKLEENVKLNHYHTTKLVLFEDDYKTFFVSSGGPMTRPALETVNCIWDIIRHKSEDKNTVTAQNATDSDFWLMMTNPGHKLSLGPYCQFRLWEKDDHQGNVVCKNLKPPIPYFLRSDDYDDDDCCYSSSSSSSSSTTSTTTLPPIPFIRLSDIYLGIPLDNKYYVSPHILAQKFYENVVNTKNDNDDDDDYDDEYNVIYENLLFILSRKPERWLRECLRHYLHLISNTNNETNSSGGQKNNHLMMIARSRFLHYRTILNKLLSVSQIVNLNISEREHLSNLKHREEFCSKL